MSPEALLGLGNLATTLLAIGMLVYSVRGGAASGFMTNLVADNQHLRQENRELGEECD